MGTSYGAPPAAMPTQYVGTAPAPAAGQQEHAIQQKGVASSHGDDEADSKSVKLSTTTMSTSITETTSIITVVNMSTIPTKKSKLIAGVPVRVLPMPGNMSKPMLSIAVDNVSPPMSSNTADILVIVNIAVYISLVVTTAC